MVTHHEHRLQQKQKQQEQQLYRTPTDKSRWNTDDGDRSSQPRSQFEPGLHDLARVGADDYSGADPGLRFTFSPILHGPKWFPSKVV